MDPIAYHKKLGGKIEVISRAKVERPEDLSVAYTPGVAEPCLAIQKDPSLVYEYTRKHNMVAVVTDGSAVLGLGNIGPEASLPVMEGKALLFKEFADVDAFPIALTTQDTDEIIETIVRISPMFGGINLEDISAPRCFEIERRLQERLNIPVFHDDQHGTAIVVLAGLYNALKVVSKNIEDIVVVMSGVGAAGVATAKLLLAAGVSDIRLIDSKGLVCDARTDLNPVKQELLSQTNKSNICGVAADAFKGADVFIGVSRPGVVSSDMVRSMAKDPIIFAMANPTPEIMPDEAKAAGAAVVATGRSDFPNQVNNVLAFPGIFRGLFDARIPQVTNEMKLAVSRALAEYVTDVSADCIMPNPLDKNVSRVVADAVKAMKNV
ncbi:MAG: NADP-dependent malic enzyme [Candidatus Magasanikbacteria bacterium]|jgi:malate dehydrogenase (oxaloacetate-decarboxylating)|nr:NADP-dependent malic enzyme [Candidatus Magasanikbacteria bacterium]MBT4220745.1 NADP-dependent malic enzyme [Candidatus Magasanikbacteria bacterium]MBT4350090.1 NADP-dependent malic enzyme [Candidatus Magasanikbacteria bacterium]MBT4541467.1 NADP-dependent malic enzyme [Candidatus Magasanikbacteria bacterium]MBT6252995.1 NADP-dependent malic enzyme [Candidatus Magasanikbacteria bacterium]